MSRLVPLVLLVLFGLASLAAYRVELPNKVPLLLVLGQDVSASFKAYDQMGVAQIEEICAKVQRSGRPALICYELVGNANNRSFKRLTIEALPTVSQQVTLTERAVIVQKRKAIQKSNREAVAIFLRQCADLLQKHKMERSTDLNGFMRKAATLMEEPTFANHEKLLFVHSDCVQDAENDRVLRVVTAPGTRLFFSGLKPQKASIKAVLFESPTGFVDYIGRSQ